MTEETRETRAATYGEASRRRRGGALLAWACAVAQGCVEPYTPLGADAGADAASQPDVAATCPGDLSNVGSGDFTVELDITTTAAAASTVAYQRQTCDAARDFWSVSTTPSGAVLFEVNQGGTQYTASSSAPFAVNDGKAHKVLAVRHSGQAYVVVDGRLVDQKPAPQALGALPPVGEASGNPCEAAGTAKPLQGEVSGLCLRRQ